MQSLRAGRSWAEPWNEDMARIIRDEKASDFSYEHDLTVQTALLQACGLPLTQDA